RAASPCCRRASRRASSTSARRQRKPPAGYPGTRMHLFSKPTLVTADDALPGRDEPIGVPERHETLGTPIAPPFPAGLEQAVVGMGCFRGAERIFWRAPGGHTAAVGYA